MKQRRFIPSGVAVKLV